MEHSTCIPSWSVTTLLISLVGFYQTAFISWFGNFVNLIRIYEKKIWIWKQTDFQCFCCHLLMIWLLKCSWQRMEDCTLSVEAQGTGTVWS